MKRYIVAANIILLTASIYFGAELAYKMIGSKLIDIQATHRPPMPPEKKKRNQSNRAHYSVIATRNLFGTNEKQSVKGPEIDLKKLKKTSLPLKLLGTIVGEDGDSMAVIFKASWRKQELFRVGDSIENAVVKMILWEKIVLNVNGAEEILEMENIGWGASQSPAPQSMRAEKKKARPYKRKISIHRSTIEKSLENVNDLIKGVSISPRFKNDQPEGIIFTKINKSSIFKRMGLSRGDILLRINGKKIQSIQDVALYEIIKNDPGMRLEFIRKNRGYEIEYEFK